jgi:hypothetical protein
MKTVYIVAGNIFRNRCALADHYDLPIAFFDGKILTYKTLGFPKNFIVVEGPITENAGALQALAQYTKDITQASQGLYDWGLN